MKNWFVNQSAREQIILLVLGFVGGGALLYLFAIEPLAVGIETRKLSVQTQQRDLQWMKQQAALVRSNPATADRTRRPMNKAPYLLLDEAIRQARIKTPDRVTPDGSQGAKAQFSDVEFDKLLRVLGGLEQTYGLTVKTINLSKKNEGMVSARLSLEVAK
ncbi:hypothetical protein AB833_16745 [Chromatiales bacterium (ex Bugula neritina AB1)]|nr:hypothetical protein AB833_16745 [Chromatiales bacterium (ex Bugula neritina AB1)]